jgi:cytochrome P450
MKESLRLGTPFRGRLPRRCPITGWTYAGHGIPSGATVSSSSYLIHYNEAVISNPGVLDPVRWLTIDEATLKPHERHFVPFSKGARACISLNFTQAEICIALATIVRLSRVVEVVDKRLVTSEIFATAITKGMESRDIKGSGLNIADTSHERREVFNGEKSSSRRIKL